MTVQDDPASIWGGATTLWDDPTTPWGGAKILWLDPMMLIASPHDWRRLDVVRMGRG